MLHFHWLIQLFVDKPLGRPLEVKIRKFLQAPSWSSWQALPAYFHAHTYRNLLVTPNGDITPNSLKWSTFRKLLTSPSSIPPWLWACIPHFFHFFIGSLVILNDEFTYLWFKTRISFKCVHEAVDELFQQTSVPTVNGHASLTILVEFLYFIGQSQ